jgi:ACS family hexuronate transporter-like MFS transporter
LAELTSSRWSRRRWGVVTLLFSATLISYLDRQTVSVLAPVLQRALHITNLQYASLAFWFLASYALCMWMFGAVFDRIGNRAGYAVAIGVWSAAAIAHAFVAGLNGLRLLRAVLGAGESGNWPGATRTVALWFAPRQRALAMGIVNTGAALGSALAPPLIVALQLHYGWQAAFVATGSLGLLWLLIWLLLYPTDSPSSPHPSALSAAVRGGGEGKGEVAPLPLANGAEPSDHLGRIPPSSAKQPRGPASRPHLRELLRTRPAWAIILARFLGDPIWWLYLSWLPLYLHDARGFTLQQIGLSAWVPFLAADLGCLAGGWLSGFLIDRGRSVDRARRTAIVVGALLMPAGMAAAWVRSPVVALACIAVTLFGFQFWVGNVQTLASDFFPARAVGSIAGLAGTAAAAGAGIFTLSTGWVVDHFSYGPILLVAGVLGPLATAVLFLVGGPVRPVRLE